MIDLRPSVLLATGMLLLAPATGRAAANPEVEVHTRPEATAPVIRKLSADAVPAPVPASVAVAPAGWIAVKIPGPLVGFVGNSDLTKTLELRDGAEIRLAASSDSPVIANAAPGEHSEITGLRGRWTQVSIDRDIIGYVQQEIPVAVPEPAPVAPREAAPLVDSSGPGRVVTRPAAPAEVPTARSFQGTLVSNRRPLAPRRPYDYQLNDSSGSRFAYLDLSRVLTTTSIDPYLDRTVVVTGVASYSEQAQGIVIAVETLTLQ